MHFHIVSELWDAEMAFTTTEKYTVLKNKIETNVSPNMEKLKKVNS